MKTICIRRPTTPKFFHADDGTKDGAFLSAEREQDTSEVVIHAPKPMRLTPEVRDAFAAWLRPDPNLARVARIEKGIQ